MKPVAICRSLLFQHRKTDSKIEHWEQWLDRHNIPWEYVDCYRSDIISLLPKYSALLWHYSHFMNADLMEAQNILNLASEMGLKVYPDYHTGWHFDDKIAEMYALQAVGAPIPRSWVFYELDKCEKWLETEAKYPLVAKLRRGSGSNNVKLLKNRAEAREYARRMFSKGYAPAPSLAYKAYSKIQSTHDWDTFVRRMKQIPNFLWTRRYGKGMPFEKGYCYFQEFIENDGFDLKGVVLGDKCTFFGRNVRAHDYRASGGGSFFYNKDLISKETILSAFQTADALKMQCVGFDYVIDKNSGRGLIVEMCHGFDADAVYDCGGYWDRDLIWHDEPLNTKTELLENMFEENAKQL